MYARHAVWSNNECVCVVLVGPVGVLNGSASATSLLADKALGTVAATYQHALGMTASIS